MLCYDAAMLTPPYYAIDAAFLHARHVSLMPFRHFDISLRYTIA